MPTFALFEQNLNSATYMFVSLKMYRIIKKHSISKTGISKHSFLSLSSKTNNDLASIELRTKNDGCFAFHQTLTNAQECLLSK